MLPFLAFSILASLSTLLASPWLRLSLVLALAVVFSTIVWLLQAQSLARNLAKTSSTQDDAREKQNIEAQALVNELDQRLESETAKSLLLEEKLVSLSSIIAAVTSKLEAMSVDELEETDPSSDQSDDSAIVSRLDEGSRLIHQNNRQAFAIAENMAANAEQAFTLSEQMQSKVSTLADEMEMSLKETEFLLTESQKITGILEVMSQVASSTHILSINASIVAARAGTHGLAFAVVAHEIRSLAESTANSLENIEILIKEIQAKIQEVADRTRQSSSAILAEKQTLLSVAGALQGVVLAVEVIRTVSGSSSEKAMELQKESQDLLALISKRSQSKSQHKVDDDLLILLDQAKEHSKMPLRS